MPSAACLIRPSGGDWPNPTQCEPQRADQKFEVTKGAVLILAPLVHSQAVAASFLGLDSGKMPTEQGLRIGHVVELSMDHVSGS